MKKTYIISEIGINHNGSLDIAKEMIAQSKKCGADAVKFQKRTIDLVYSKEQLIKLRTSPWGTTEREQKQGLEFSKDEYIEIDKYCKKLNIDWFASAWDLESLKFLDYFDLDYIDDLVDEYINFPKDMSVVSIGKLVPIIMLCYVGWYGR